MNNDKPQHECGIFGIYAPDEDVARLTFFGLYALQHRGQESAGIAVSDGQHIVSHKDMGLVAQVFDEHKLRPLQGHIAIGHTRYSTTGSSKIQNAQPFLIESVLGQLAVGHNGNLTNASSLRRELLQRGVGLSSSSDSEVIVQMLAGGEGRSWAEKLRIYGACSGGLLPDGANTGYAVCATRSLGLASTVSGAHWRAGLGGGLGELCAGDDWR